MYELHIKYDHLHGLHDYHDLRDFHDLRDLHDLHDAHDLRDARGLHDYYDYCGVPDGGKVQKL